MKEKEGEIYKSMDISENSLDVDLNKNLYKPFKLLKTKLPDLAIPGTEIVNDIKVNETNELDVPQDSKQDS